MTQKALVKSVTDRYAVVEVSRSSMCDGCSQKNCQSHTCSAGEIFGAGKQMCTKAVNRVGAVPGDVVLVESEDKTVLSKAALVFLMPLAVCILFYTIAERLCSNMTVHYVAAGIGFVIAFCILGCIEHRRSEQTPDIVIVDILPGKDTTEDNLKYIQDENTDEKTESLDH